MIDAGSSPAWVPYLEKNNGWIWHRQRRHWFGVNMDTIEAKKNLNALCNEIEKLQNLSRSLMTAKEMLDIDAKIKRHKDQVKNIRSNLHA